MLAMSVLPWHGDHAPQPQPGQVIRITDIRGTVCLVMGTYFVGSQVEPNVLYKLRLRVSLLENLQNLCDKRVPAGKIHIKFMYRVFAPGLLRGSPATRPSNWLG